MNTGVVSMRYAKALLAYAKAQKVEDRVYEEVKTLAGHYVSCLLYTSPSPRD